MAIIEPIRITVPVPGVVKIDISLLLIITEISSRRERPTAKKNIFKISGLNSSKISHIGFNLLFFCFWILAKIEENERSKGRSLCISCVHTVYVALVMSSVVSRNNKLSNTPISFYILKVLECS